MFSVSFNLASYTNTSFGPSVTGVAYTGPSAAGATPEPSDLTIPWQDVVENPSEFALLSWHTRVSEFAGRDREMEELKQWANNDCAEVVLGHLEHRLSEWLPNALDGKPDRCKLLEPFFSKKVQQSIGITKAAVVVYKTLLHLTEKEKRKAALLNNLSLYLSSLGNRQAALNATFDTVEIQERLAESNPGAFESALAMSLSNLGNRYFEVGDREKALDAAIRAVEIRERLAESNPEAFEPDLATSLNNLGNRYFEVGDRQKALETAIRAMEIRERLAKSNPEAFEPDLAMSLNNLGISYSVVGDRQKALDSAIRAVEIRERLAKSNPEAFEPALATSLNNLGNRYADV